MKTILKFIATVLLLGMQGAFAQSTSLGYSDLQSGSPEILSLSVSTSSSVTGLKTSTLKVDLVSGEDYELAGYSFSAGLKADLKFSGTGFSDITKTITLEIDDNMPQNSIIINTIHFIPPEYQISQVEVAASDFVVSAANDVQEYLEDNLVMNLTYEHTLRQDHNNETQQITASSYAISGKRVTLDWTENSILYPTYEVQLLKLHNLNEEYAWYGNNLVPLGIEANIDWRKALTIVTAGPKNSLELALGDGSGFYIWRVRALGNQYEDGAANPKNFGKWFPDSNTSYVDVLSDDLHTYNIFYYEDPDAEKNYIFSRTFTEGDDHIAENITYANGLLQTQQSQKYFPSEDTKVILQSIYDLESRSAITVLPVPENGNITGYKGELVLDAGNNLYSYNDFDTPDKVNNPDQMEGTALDYYENNSTERVASAGHYPFSRTRYTTDGTNRVSEQNQPGSDFKPGSGKAVKYWYLTPSQEELTSVFGDEAPKASAVTKTVIKDPNGIYSVKYTSTDGKTIATCLAFSRTESNSMTIPDGYDTIVSSLTHMVVDNYKDGDTLVAVSSLSLSAANAIDVEYRLPVEAVETPCGAANADCGYKLKLTIFDLDSQTTAYSNIFDVALSSGAVIDTWGDTTLYKWNLLNDHNLDAGNYYMVKKLYQGNPDDLFNAVDPTPSVQPYTDFIDTKLDMVSDAASQMDFFSDILEFGDDLELVHSNQMTEADFRQKWTLPQTTVVAAEHSLELYTDSETNGMVLVTSIDDLIGQENAFKRLDLNTPCCGIITIPVVFPLLFDCPKEEDLEDGDPDFEQFFYDMLCGGKKDDETWDNFMPNWGDGEFNTLIFNMLRYEIEDPENPGTYIKAYNCQDLWKVWIALLTSYSNENPEYPENFCEKIFTTDETAADELDENMNFEGFAAWLVKKIIGRKLSKKLQEEEDALEGTDNEPLPSANLPEQFLNLVGYKFEKILTDPTVEFDPDYNPARRFYIGQSSQNPEDNDLRAHPYIMDRCFAFRYYTYYLTDVNNRKPACEVLNCFRPNLDFDDYCIDPPECAGDISSFEDYGEEERENFLQCLMSYVPEQNTTTCSECKWDEDYGKPYTDARYYEVYLKDSVITQCENQCEALKEYYKDVIEQTLWERCYDIGGCHTNPNYISWAMVDAIADEIVGDCRSYCNMSGVFICEEETDCNDINELNLTPLSGRYKTDFELTCDRIKLQVSQWFLEFDIESMCEGEEGTYPSGIDTNIPLHTVESCTEVLPDLREIKSTLPKTCSSTEFQNTYTIERK